MDFLFLLPAAVFAGLPLGLLLAWIARKELAEDLKYIGYFRQVLAFAIALLSIAFLFKHSIPWVGFVSILAGIGLAVFLNIMHARLERDRRNFMFDYLILGLCMTSAIAVLERNSLLLFSFLAFLYGLAYSGVFYKRLKNGLELFAFDFVLFFAPFPFLLLGNVAVVGFGLSAFYLLLRAR